MPESILQRSQKDFRDNIVIESSSDRTYVIVLAVHPSLEKNILTKISCRRGNPINGYLFDSQSESYHAECHDYIVLGYVPISFTMTLPGVGRWKQVIPMAEQTLRRYFTAEQKKDLRSFKRTYKGLTFQFMQIIDCF